MGGSMSAAYRPPQGQQKEKLSILSLSVFSWVCTSSFFCFLPFLYLPPFLAQASQIKKKKKKLFGVPSEK